MRQTFLGFRHAFLPHAWRTPRNVCVGGYKPQPDQHSGSWITEKKVLPLKWHLQSVRLSCPLGYEWKIVCPVSRHFHFSFSKFGVLDRWSRTRSCHTWRLNCISIDRALFMGRITTHSQWVSVNKEPARNTPWQTRKPRSNLTFRGCSWLVLGFTDILPKWGDRILKHKRPKYD